MGTVKSATVKKDVEGKKAVKAAKATKVVNAKKDKKKVTEAELWAMVAVLPRRNRRYKRIGRQLSEFTDEKGVVDTAALEAAVAAAKRL